MDLLRPARPGEGRARGRGIGPRRGPGAHGSLGRVVENGVHLDGEARQIGLQCGADRWFGPEVLPEERVHLGEVVEVAEIDPDPHGVTEARPGCLGGLGEVGESGVWLLRERALDQRPVGAVGRGPGEVDEVAGDDGVGIGTAGRGGLGCVDGLLGHGNPPCAACFFWVVRVSWVLGSGQNTVRTASTTWFSPSRTGIRDHLSKTVQGWDSPNSITSPTRNSGASSARSRNPWWSLSSTTLTPSPTGRRRPSRSTARGTGRSMSKDMSRLPAPKSTRPGSGQESTRAKHESAGRRGSGSASERRGEARSMNWSSWVI